jgi:sulfate adenylyltransferase subunit 1 (EFTu-like GTPase family)
MATFLGLHVRPICLFVTSFDGATWKEERFGHVRQTYIMPASKLLKKEMPLLPVMSA